MSLAGTLDTFALPDVLRFLGAGNKTGRLSIVAAHGNGDIWLRDGAIVAVTFGSIRDLLDAACDLLRVDAGSFSFEDDAMADDEGEPLPVDALLRQAQERGEAWDDLRVVIPSELVSVALAPTVDDDVTLTPGDWKTIVALAGGCQVADACERLNQSQFDVSTKLKDLVARALVIVEGLGVGAETTDQKLDHKPDGTTDATAEEAAEEAAEAVAEEAAEAVAEEAVAEEAPVEDRTAAEVDDEVEPEVPTSDGSDPAPPSADTDTPDDTAAADTAADDTAADEEGSVASTVATERGRTAEAIRRLTARTSGADDEPVATDEDDESSVPATARAADVEAGASEPATTGAATMSAADGDPEKIDGPAYAAGIRELGVDGDRGKLLKFLSSVRT